MLRFLRAAVIVVSVLTLVVIGLALLADWYVRRSYEEVFEQYTADARTHLPSFETLRDKVSAHPFFSQSRRESDAGPYLNSRLPWGDHDEHAHRQLALPPAVADRLASWGPDWFQAGVADKFVPVDTGWLAGLAEYGHWSLLPGSPIESSHGPLNAMPSPFGPLVGWAKLRLIEGALKDDLPAAQRATRHLAWLAYSTESSVGQRIALRLLELEHSLPESERLETVSVAELAEWRTLFWSAMLYANVLVSPDLYRRAFPLSMAIPGHCAGLHELADFALPARDAIEHRFSERYALLDDALHGGTKGCRLEVLVHLNGSVPSGGTPLDGPRWWMSRGSGVTEAGVLQRFVERRVGLLLAALSAPGGFERLGER